jgi:hypothetical protein
MVLLMRLKHSTGKGEIKMKSYLYNSKNLYRYVFKTGILIIIAFSFVMANSVEKAKADVISLLPTDMFLAMIEKQERLEIISRFLDLNPDKEFLFLDYEPDSDDLGELDFSGFSEDTQCSDSQCMVFFSMPSIIIIEISDLFPITPEKEQGIKDRIESIIGFYVQNPDKEFLFLDYDSESGEAQIIEIPYFADISEQIKWIESSTGWQLDEPYSPEDQIADIIESFNNSMENYDLEGRGSGWLAKLRLFLMREMLIITDELIASDRINAACIILQRAYLRCDGNPLPLPDFVVGDAVPELVDMIQTLRASLGCE